MLEFLVAKADQRLERDLVAEPVIAAQLQNLSVDKAFDQAEDVGVGPALDLADDRFSPADSVVKASASISPSGKNLWAVSKRRPRITSSSTFQRTRLDVSTQRAYRSVVEILWTAFIVRLLFGVMRRRVG